MTEIYFGQAVELAGFQGLFFPVNHRGYKYAMEILPPSYGEIHLLNGFISYKEDAIIYYLSTSELKMLKLYGDGSAFAFHRREDISYMPNKLVFHFWLQRAAEYSLGKKVVYRPSMLLKNMYNGFTWYYTPEGEAFWAKFLNKNEDPTEEELAILKKGELKEEPLLIETDNNKSIVI